MAKKLNKKTKKKSTDSVSKKDETTDLKARCFIFGTYVYPPPLYFNLSDPYSPWSERVVSNFIELYDKYEKGLITESDFKLEEDKWRKAFNVVEPSSGLKGVPNYIHWFEHTYFYHRRVSSSEFARIEKLEQAKLEKEELSDKINDYKSKLSDTNLSDDDRTSYNEELLELERILSEDYSAEKLKEIFDKDYVKGSYISKGQEKETYFIDEIVPLDKNYCYLSEETILKTLKEYTSITDWFYCIHDSDTIDLDEEDTPSYIDFTPRIENSEGRNLVHKIAHFHLVVFASGPISINRFAKRLGFEGREQYFSVKKAGKGGREQLLYDLVSYLPHRNQSGDDGKFRYPDSIIKSNWKHSELVKFLDNYQPLEEVEITKKRIARAIQRGVPLAEVKEQYGDTDAYIQEFKNFKTYRALYLRDNAPRPDFVFNFYVFGTGGSGKDTLIKYFHHFICNDKDSAFDVARYNEYSYLVGDSGLAFNDYTGQFCNHLADKRPVDLISMLYKSRTTFLVATDPSYTLFNINQKYGSSVMVAGINSFSSVMNPFNFFDSLSGEYVDRHTGERILAEDKGQVYRRFGLLCELVPSTERDVAHMILYVSKYWLSGFDNSVNKFEYEKIRYDGSPVDVLNLGLSPEDTSKVMYQFVKPIIDWYNKFHDLFKNRSHNVVNDNIVNRIGRATWCNVEDDLKNNVEFTERDRTRLGIYLDYIEKELPEKETKLSELKARSVKLQAELSCAEKTSYFSPSSLEFVDLIKRLKDEDVALQSDIGSCKNRISVLKERLPQVRNLLQNNLNDIKRIKEFKSFCIRGKNLFDLYFTDTSDFMNEDFFENFLPFIEYDNQNIQPDVYLKYETLSVTDFFNLLGHYGSIFTGDSSSDLEKKFVASNVKNLKKFVEQFKILDENDVIKKSEFYEIYSEYFHLTQTFLNYLLHQND